MTAKTYLNKIRLANIHINELLLERERLFTQATRITSITDKDVVQSSGSGDKLMNAAIKIVEIENKIDKYIDEYVDMKDEAYTLLQKMENPVHLQVLYRKYFQGLKLYIIAEQLDYDEAYMRRLHHMALIEFETILKGRYRKIR